MSEFLWVEKYRPQKIQDCILPKSIKKTFEDIVRGGDLHNMLLTGTAGLGKTTVAKALCVIKLNNSLHQYHSKVVIR